MGMKKRWKGRGAGVLFVQMRGRRSQREKAGIGEKGVLVLWSGVCGGAVAEIRWRNGGALAGGWLIEKKKIRKMGATTWFRPGEKIRFRVFLWLL